MLFYFFYVQIFLITVEQFFGVFTQKYFQNVIYLKLPISECISPIVLRKPPLTLVFTILHICKVVKVFKEVIGSFPLPFSQKT